MKGGCRPTFALKIPLVTNSDWLALPLLPLFAVLVPVDLHELALDVEYANGTRHPGTVGSCSLDPSPVHALLARGCCW